MTTENTYTNYEVSPLGSILIISSVIFLIIVRLVHKIFCGKLQTSYTSLPTRKQQTAAIYTAKIVFYTGAVIIGFKSAEAQKFIYRIFTNSFAMIDKDIYLEIAASMITVAYLYDLAVRQDLSWSLFLHHATGLAGTCLFFNLKFNVSYSFMVCHGLFQILEQPFQFTLVHYALFKSPKYIMMGTVTFALSKILNHIVLIILFVQESNILETWFLALNIVMQVLLIVTQVDTIRILLVMRNKAMKETREMLEVSPVSEETLKEFTKTQLKDVHV